MQAKIERLECPVCCGTGVYDYPEPPGKEDEKCPRCLGTDFCDYRLTEEARQKIVEALIDGKNGIEGLAAEYGGTDNAELIVEALALLQTEEEK